MRASHPFCKSNIDRWLAIGVACLCLLNVAYARADDLLEPKVEPILAKAPNRPYNVGGKVYEPFVADEPFRQRGRCSWYGVPFHGRRTASGETFNMHDMTAAHPTLPIPSYARVRLVGTDRSVIVRINDRGPFHGARVMDLSYAAASQLGILGQGTAEVDIERLTFDDIRTGRWRQADEPVLAQSPLDNAAQSIAPGSNDPVMALIEMLPAAGQSDPVAVVPQSTALAQNAPNSPLPADSASAPIAQPTAVPYWVQLAAFDQDTGAEVFRRRVQNELGDLAQSLGVYKDGAHIRLQLGPFPGPAEAALAARRVRSLLQLTPLIVQRS